MGIILEKNDNWGFIVDDAGVVRALWFADYESLKKPMRIRVVLGYVEAQGKTVEIRDFAAAVEGRCRIDEGGRRRRLSALVSFLLAADSIAKPVPASRDREGRPACSSCFQTINQEQRFQVER